MSNGPDAADAADLRLPVEYPITVYLNDQELATIQATPVELEDLACGFLYTEGLVTDPGQLRRIVADYDRGQVWVDADVSADVETQVVAGRRYLTSGCGRGVTFSSIGDAARLGAVASQVTCPPEAIQAGMRLLMRNTPLYLETGGMHAAALMDQAAAPAASGGDAPEAGGREAQGERLLVVREDIGRHNAVDKVVGAALRARLDPRRLIILTTGRISYEMITKMARFGVGIAASRTAATDQAVRLAERMGICVVGYVRGGRMRVFSHPERLAAG